LRDVDLLKTGLLDSLQLVYLLLLIEEEFGRRISLEAIELDDLRSLARLAELVSRPRSPPRPAAQSHLRPSQAALPEPMRDGAWPPARAESPC